jgi:hypothetical protein
MGSLVPGRAGVPGRASGRIVHLDDLTRNGTPAGHCAGVLVTRHSAPEIYGWASHLAAVVAANGSRLCHLAILLREHRPRPIPYLYGIPDLDAIPRGGWGDVVVECDSGWVRVDEPGELRG